MPSSTVRAPSRRVRVRRTRRVSRRRWRRWARRPDALRLVLLAAAGLALLAAANYAVQVARKPSELLFPVSTILAKRPAETWRAYGPLFRRYSTAAVSPALLAALAQVESAGNPLARTYWRGRLTWRPFAIYAPASSSVGMYQMTDAAFAEARHYCIRDHTVTGECRLRGLYTRILPRHAVELASIYLDSNIAAILARRRHGGASPRQVERLAAIVHLCGAGPATSFARRGFRLAPGERCGDQEAADYLARVEALSGAFRSLAGAH